MKDTIEDVNPAKRGNRGLTVLEVALMAMSYMFATTGLLCSTFLFLRGRTFEAVLMLFFTVLIVPNVKVVTSGGSR